MITLSQIRPGMTIMYEGKETTVLQGSYEEPNVGLMIKTSLHPGGFPASRYELLGNTEQLEVVETIPAVSFELAIVDETEPVRITADLIREKSKVLTDLTIKNMFDEVGYTAVKKAVTKAVKTRTNIEKKEKEVLDAMKLRHASEKKEVTDYTAELYKACREAQTMLEAKLIAIDNEKKIAADKLAAEEKERTEGRESKMYEVGLTFNGQAFVGYGKTITKNSLHSFSQEAFDGLVTELEVLQMDSEVSGKPQEVVAPVIGGEGSRFTIRPSANFEDDDEPKKLFDTEIYSVSVGGYTWVLTKGQVTTIEGQVIANQQVATSAIYSQVIATGFNK